MGGEQGEEKKNAQDQWTKREDQEKTKVVEDPSEEKENN